MWVEVPGDGERRSPGRYKCAESAGKVRGANAIAWWYDWQPVAHDDESEVES